MLDFQVRSTFQAAEPEPRTTGTEPPDLGYLKGGIERQASPRASAVVDLDPEIGGWVDLEVDLLLTPDGGLAGQVEALVGLFSPPLAQSAPSPAERGRPGSLAGNAE